MLHIVCVQISRIICTKFVSKHKYTLREKNPRRNTSWKESKRKSLTEIEADSWLLMFEIPFFSSLSILRMFYSFLFSQIHCSSTKSYKKKMLALKVLSLQRNPTVAIVLKIENFNHLSEVRTEIVPEHPEFLHERWDQADWKRLPGRVNVRDVIPLPVNASLERRLLTPTEK